MAMTHGVTLTFLLSLICYIAAQAKNGSITTTGGTNTTELTPVTFMSSNSTTTVGLPTLQATALISTSNQNVPNVSTTSTSTSGPEGTWVSSTVMVSNTSLSTSTLHSSMPNVTSSSTDEYVSTTEMQTALSNVTFITTSSPVNMTNTISEAPTIQTAATSEMPTNTTANVTQTSTLEHTTIPPTHYSSSATISATSGHMNFTVSTVDSANGTSMAVTPNITSTSTPATIETSVNATVPVTTTVPMNATSEATTQGTEVSNSTWSTAQTSAKQSADHCANITCPPSSKCVNLFVSYKCQCLLGLFEKANNCITVRIFPGILHLKNITFTDDMKEINSKAFYDIATDIEKEMKSFFKDDNSYYKSIVRKLGKGSVKAFVDNIFAHSSKATLESVDASVKDGIKNCSSCTLVSRSDSYNGENICSLNPCDVSTSRCEANNGIATCNCLPGYFKFLSSDQSCKACLSGFKLENGTCVKCPFGYGGFNCDKSYLLAVVVISCVLGGLLILLFLALITTCVRSRNGSCSSSSGSHDYVMWPKSEMPKIPRATMHWDGNQLEMQENGSTSSLNDIHRDGGRTPEKNDDLKTFKGKQQSRYTYLCQGQENPYYVSDEKKPEYL
ncbi:protein HEG-like [Cetorhinus maximus]